LGQSVSFTVVVSGVSPTGMVQFMDGSTSLGVVAVNAGSATLVVSDLTLGTHNVMAVYAGDASNQASVSAPLVQTIVAAVDTSGNADTPTLPEWGAIAMALSLLTLMVQRNRQA